MERMVGQAQSQVIRKLVFNTIVLVSYIVVLSLLYSGKLERQAGKEPEGWAIGLGAICMTLWLVWGFIAGARLLNQLFTKLAGLMGFQFWLASCSAWGCVSLIAGFILAVVLGPFVVVCLILSEIVHLVGFRKNLSRMLT